MATSINIALFGFTHPLDMMLITSFGYLTSAGPGPATMGGMRPGQMRGTYTGDWDFFRPGSCRGPYTGEA